MMIVGMIVGFLIFLLGMLFGAALVQAERETVQRDIDFEV